MLSNMNRSLFWAYLVAFLEVEATRSASRPKSIAISKSAPRDSGIPLESFVSFSFELSSWPDYAGITNTHPYSCSVVLILHLQATYRTQMLSPATS